MRAVGMMLMALGAFFIVVAALTILGPGLRALGIDVGGNSTSLIGTSLIGVFSFATGVLLRRRGHDAARDRTAMAESKRSTALGSGASEPLEPPAREHAEVRRDDGRR